MSGGSSESPNLIGFHWSLMTTAGNPEHTLPIQFQHCYILTLQANGKNADNISQKFAHQKYYLGCFLSNIYLYVGQLFQSVAFNSYCTSADSHQPRGQVYLWKILNLVGKEKLISMHEQFLVLIWISSKVLLELKMFSVVEGIYKCSKVLSLFLSSSLVQIVVQPTHSEVQSAGNGSHMTLKL